MKSNIRKFPSLWGRSLANNDMISLPHLIFIKIYNRRGKVIFMLYFLFLYFPFYCHQYLHRCRLLCLPLPGKCRFITFPIYYLLSHSVSHCLPKSQRTVLLPWWQTKHYHRMTIYSTTFRFAQLFAVLLDNNYGNQFNSMMVSVN